MNPWDTLFEADRGLLLSRWVSPGEVAAPGSATLSAAVLQHDAPRLATLWAEAGLRPGDPVAVASADDPMVLLVVLTGLRYGHPVMLLDPAAPYPQVPALVLAKALIADPAVAGDRPGAWTFEGPRWWVRRAAPPTVWERLTGRKSAVSAEDLPAALSTVTPRERPDPRRFDPDALALLLPTGGTTGVPRVVPHTRRAIAAQLGTLGAALQLNRDSRVLGLMPLHHYDGIVMGALAPIAAGGCALRSPSFRLTGLTDVLDGLYRERATHLVTVPSVLALLVRLGEDLRASFVPGAMVVSTAAPLPTPVWTNFLDRSGVKLVNVYGLTETGNLFFAGPDPDSGLPGTVGRPRDCEVALLDEAGAPVADGEVGELWLRGDSVMRAYWGQEPATDTRGPGPGWLATGDLLSRRSDGLYTVAGRRRAMAKVAGHAVFPAEVDELLASHPAVADVATTAVPDEVWGERLVSYVVLVAPEPGVAGLMDWLGERLVPHKLPREIVVVPAVPRSPQGKIRWEEVVITSGATGDLSARVLAVAARVFRVPARTLSLGSGPSEVASWDSLAHLDLIAALEAELGVHIAARDVFTLRTLGDAVRLLTPTR